MENSCAVPRVAFNSQPSCRLVECDVHRPAVFCCKVHPGSRASARAGVLPEHRICSRHVYERCHRAESISFTQEHHSQAVSAENGAPAFEQGLCQHRIILQPDSDVLIARMDARLITQVLINLVNNAVKNTQTGSEIRIVSGREGDLIRVSVEDNGSGIPDDMKPHIFEMFYTGQNVVSDGRRGIGLGLALCRSIVEAHGGEITLTDNVPSGCCFTFTLPAGEVTINE